ncbi:hypothetical protein BDN70DRAFT_674715 [Pholiota conissans]|uniref:Uncharacterized protein n=1 Tax=Pholiota conissans TaxID=109636 RepID=A0A9P6CTR3_9AGAR|nr:hypothetical protein BDN70DRAFT_674715 [Pholiota conissans]
MRALERRFSLFNVLRCMSVDLMYDVAHICILLVQHLRNYGPNRIHLCQPCPTPQVLTHIIPSPLYGDFNRTRCRVLVVLS